MKIFRWILTPLACFVAWHVALFIGIVLLAFAQSYYDDEHIDSGISTSPSWPIVEASVFYFSTGLSGVFVVATAYFVAPHDRLKAAWLALAIGGAIALSMAFQIAKGGTTSSASPWGMFTSAIIGGLFAILILAKLRIFQATEPSTESSPVATKA